MIKILRQVANGQNSLRGAAGLLVITLFLSNLLGVVRNYLLTHYIPVTSLDVYYAAFRLPDLIFNLLILGAISSALIPVFTEYWQKKNVKEAWHIVNAVLTLAFIGLAIALGLLFILMPYLMNLVVPNFSPHERTQTVTIARLMLLSPLFFGVSYIFSGILNSFQRFVTSSIAPLVYNFSIIIGIAVFARLYPAGDFRQLVWVAIFVVFGAFLHMIIQIPSVRHVGLRLSWVYDLKHLAVRKIGRLMIPRTVGLGANQFLIITFTAFASAFPGAVSYYSLANDIQTMPVVVFGLSFATAIFPSLSASAGREDLEKFTYYLNRTANIIIALQIPAAVILILLRVGIVQALLGFNLQNSIPTANTLAMFSLSLLATGIIPLFSRAYYAVQDTRTPTIIAVISVLLSIAMVFILRTISDLHMSFGSRFDQFIIGAPGLALAYSVGTIFNAVVLFIPLRNRFRGFATRDTLRTFIYVLLASLLMGMVIYYTSHLIAGLLNVKDTRLGMFSQITVSAVLGIAVYLTAAWLLGIKEVQTLWKRDIKN